VKTGALAIALFALAGCYHRRDRVVGPEPTPFVIQGSSSSVAGAAPSPAGDGNDDSEAAGVTSSERDRARVPRAAPEPRRLS